MFKKGAFTLVSLMSFCFSFSQEKVGVISDNYLPVNQLMNNPASIVDQKVWMSINLVGAHAFARNNFLYIPDSRLGLSILDKDFAFDPPDKNGKAFLAAEVMGPSVSLNWKKHAFGLHTAIRGYGSMSKIPTVLGKIIADEDAEDIEDGTYLMNNGRAKSMVWSEVGFSYGQNFYRRDQILINGAATLKRIVGIQQASTIIDDARVDVMNGEGTLRNIDGKYSYSDPSYGAGKGWGLNLGANYKKYPIKTNVGGHVPHSREGGCKIPEYIYKVGFSLIDFGYIRFKQSSTTANLNDSVSVDDLEDGRSEVLGEDENKYTAALPSAVSVQFDYNFQNGFYANALLVQKVSLANSFGVERSNVFAITPRFESSWISAGLPLSLSNYTTPQVGLYLRVGPLALGTDHLSSFILKRDIRAADFYFYLNIPIQKSPECRDEKAKESGKWICPVW